MGCAGLIIGVQQSVGGCAGRRWVRCPGGTSSQGCRGGSCSPGASAGGTTAARGGIIAPTAAAASASTGPAAGCGRRGEETLGGDAGKAAGGNAGCRGSATGTATGSAATAGAGQGAAKSGRAGSDRTHFQHPRKFLGTIRPQLYPLDVARQRFPRHCHPLYRGGITCTGSASPPAHPTGKGPHYGCGDGRTEIDEFAMAGAPGTGGASAGGATGKASPGAGVAEKATGAAGGAGEGAGGAAGSHCEGAGGAEGGGRAQEAGGGAGRSSSSTTANSTCDYRCTLVLCRSSGKHPRTFRGRRDASVARRWLFQGRFAHQSEFRWTISHFGKLLF
mmetsp:Transcript_37630/g.78836  ORF Transcript_37630/g.78836 Transcript_37630/m.78836 type:complete len:333 (-) Transcript_37630:585-1583(-)